ncbi:hypothetical protein ACQ4PT_059844 [Festuca glaucescens]
METVLMQQTAAAVGPARRRCVGKMALAGNRWQVVRLAGTARCAASWGVRARPGLARAQLVAEQRTEIAGESVDDDARAMRLFVGLPADVVSSDGNAVSRPRAIRAGLRALKLLGVHGVELPVSWAIVQPGSAEQFDWTGYLAVAGMVRDAGLSLRVSLLTHGRGATLPDKVSDDGTDSIADAGTLVQNTVDNAGTPLLDAVADAEADTALPGWVADALVADHDILFTDRSGNRRKECLSFAVDELPVLAGKSPLQACEAFFRSFADAFQDFLGSTLTVRQNITCFFDYFRTLPQHKLQLFYLDYYSTGHDRQPGSRRRAPVPVVSAGMRLRCVDGYAGAGEFQCYDKHMLARLKQHADSSDHLTYQRMGAEFFSPDHWPLFVQFARDLEFPEEAHEDDLPADGGQLAPLSGRVEQGAEKEAQVA